MCLEKVTAVYEEPLALKRARRGYKVVYNNGICFSSPFYFTEIPKNGSWITDFRTVSNDTVEYPLGFHIFTRLIDAVRYNRWQMVMIYGTNWDFIIIPVQYNDVVAEGTEDIFYKDVPVVIARRMRYDHVQHRKMLNKGK